MSNDIITTDLQSQEVDALIELYELELLNGTILYFHPGLDETLDEIQYDGNTYIALPIMLDGIEASSDGAANRPTLTVANVSNLFKAALAGENFSFEDLIGTKITRRQTLEKYLATGLYEFPKKVYLLDRISSENNITVSFELSAPFDVSGIKIPNRVVVGKYCSWIYQGLSRADKKGGCKWRSDNAVDYNGSRYYAYFDLNDRVLIENGSVAFSALSSSHSIDDFVSYNGQYWRSEADSNTDTPSESSLFWKEVLLWVNWSSNSNYSTGNYVKYDNKIWRALLPSTATEPSVSSIYWKRVDYCGKTLESCKARFQFTATPEGAPSAIKETDKILPFGAFPGSVKFK
jgi:lambda family phage minor tail protein L